MSSINTFPGPGAPVLPVLDLQALCTAAPDRRVQGLMYAALVRQAPVLLERMRMAVDAAEWQAALHALRGACSTLGGAQVTQVLAQHERDPRSADATWRSQQAPRLASDVEELMRALQRHLV